MIPFKDFLFNHLYNDDYETGYTVDYDTDDPEQTMLIRIAEELAEDTINELRHPILEKKTDHSEEDAKDETVQNLRKAILSYGICIAYLGPNRMTDIVKFLNPGRINQLVKDKSQLAKFYLRLLRIAKSSDNTGLTGINLKYDGQKLSIRNLLPATNQSSNSNKLYSNSIWVYPFQKLYNLIRRVRITKGLMNMCQRRTNLGVMYKALNTFFNIENLKEIQSFKDLENAEKARNGVTWAKNITMAEINKMNLKGQDIDDEEANEKNNKEINYLFNNKNKFLVSFFKALVIMPRLYGVSVNEKIFTKLADFSNANMNDVEE